MRRKKERIEKKKEKSFFLAKMRVTSLESALSSFLLRCSSPLHLVEKVEKVVKTLV